MSEIYCIIECKITFNDGKVEIRRPLYHNISIGITSVNKNSLVDYYMQGLPNVKEVKIIDILYFNTKEDYQEYLKFHL